MRYVYSVHTFGTLSVDKAHALLPQHFSFEEKDGQRLLVVTQQPGETDEDVFGQVQRECDRLFYLTGEQLDPRLLRPENLDGSTTSSQSFHARAWIVKPLDKFDCQLWQGPHLTRQLRLWYLAHLPNVPIAARINLLFQIVETSDPPPHYPAYEEADRRADKPPDPRTESKLLRHLASHSGTPDREELKQYCRYLHIEQKMYDPTDKDQARVLQGRLPIVEGLASRLIKASITRKP